MSSLASSKAPNKISKRQQRMVKWGAVVLVAIVALFGIYELGRQANKWGEPDELRVIKAESMAKDDLLGLELVETRVDGEGDLISKTVSPRIERSFRVNGDDIETVMDRLIKMAEEDGWKHDPRLFKSSDWRGRKTINQFDLTLIIDPNINNNLIRIAIF